MSLRHVPAAGHTSSTTNLHSSAEKNISSGAPSAPGIHDTLRSGLAATGTEINSKHPLEARLKKWDAQQEELKMEGLRRMFGIQEPIRRGMEIKIAGSDFRPTALGGPSNLHLDILRNKDTDIQWEDIFTGDATRDIPDFHTEMEAKLRMNW